MIEDDQYLEAKVMTATPHQLHLMVIEAAIRFASQAEAALEAQDFEATHLALNNARSCVAEAISGLNDDAAPELVDRLKGLFAFAYRRLVDADLKNDLTLIGDALGVLRTHRETWLTLGEQLRTSDSSGAASADADDTGQPRSWTG